MLKLQRVIPLVGDIGEEVILAINTAQLIYKMDFFILPAVFFYLSLFSFFPFPLRDFQKEKQETSR